MLSDPLLRGGENVQPLRRGGKGGDGQWGFGGDGRGGADLGGCWRLGGQQLIGVDVADILTGGDDIHHDSVVRKLFADLAENKGGFSTVIIDPRAVQTGEGGTVGVIVEHGGVGEG